MEEIVIEIPEEFERLFDTDWREAAIYGGRFCLGGDTMVSMWNGDYKRISSLVVGDTVLSKEGEPDIIVDIQKFEAEYDPKPIIELNINGTITTTTYDHKYFDGANYVPIYQLVWGIMAPSQRRTLELLCKQYGQTTHNELQRWLQDGGDETSDKPHRVFNDCDRREDETSTSSSSENIYTKSKKQGDGKSQERNKDRQSYREYGVGNEEGAVKAFVGYWTKEGRSQNGKQLQEGNRKGGERVAAVSFRESHNANTNNGGVTNEQDGFELRWDTGFTKWQDLETPSSRVPLQKDGGLGSEEVRITVERVSESVETYDITTQKHHNFFANGVNVSNSLKSHTVARYLLIRARMAKTRILCAREYQNSIADSSHQLLSDLISHYGLADFRVTDKQITNTITGSEFLFKGLHHNEQSIKSIEGVDIAWVEEAQTITQNSLEILTPTIRQDGSQIIYTYNRLLEDDPVHRRLVLEGRPNTLKINVNYDIALKYGYMPDVIRLEMEDDKANRPSLYKVKWLGEPSSVEGRIFRDWVMIDVIPHEARKVGRGLDFGYSVDPTACIEVYEYNGGYILDELIYRKGMSNAEIATALKEGDILTVADCAEPKSIDELKAYGLTVVAAEKGADSVLHGIQVMQDQRISVTSRSQNLWQEYNRYMWDRDKDGRWLQRPENGNDHALDGVRYFLQRHLKKNVNDTKEFYDKLKMKKYGYTFSTPRSAPRAGLR